MAASEASEKVVYQYTLVKKIRRNPILSPVYLLLPFLCGAMLSLKSDSSMVWPALAASIILFIAIEFITLLVLSWARPGWESLSSRYSLVARTPWIGFFPNQPVSSRIYRSITLHSVWLSALVAAFALSWLPIWEAAAAVFSTLWMSVPRLWLLAALRQGMKGAHVIRFQENDVSLYIS
jgi:hypothetical protein